MIKNYLIVAMILIIATLSVTAYFQFKKNSELKNSWSISENNYKASNRKNLEYSVSIDQLNKSNDSLDKKLISFAKRNKLKDSKINSLMIIVDSLRKKDTVVFKDTIFVKNLSIDTIVGDKWIKKKLKLRYPNKIEINEEIYNEKNIA